MALIDYAKKKKDQLSAALSQGASGIKSFLNRPVGPTGQAYVQKSNDIRQNAVNAVANAPQFNFSESKPLESRPLLKLGAQVAEGTLNIPSRLMQNYGKTLQDIESRKIGTSTGFRQFAARTGENVLDVISLGKGKAAVGAGQQFLKGITPLKTLMQQGARQGFKTGAKYGFGYGVLGEAQKEQTSLRNILDQGAQGAVSGSLVGGVLGGTLPALGALPKTIKNSLRQRITTESLPGRWVDNGVTRLPTIDGPMTIPNPAPGTRHIGGPFQTGFDPVSQSPTYGIHTEKFLPPQTVERGRVGPTVGDLMGQVREAVPRPGMSIEDVTRGKTDDVVRAEAEAMIDLQRQTGGVSTIRTGNDFTPGDGYVRASSNPQWYRDFYKENGRAPSKRDIIEIARQNLEKGKGYLQDEFNRAKNPTPDDVNETLASFGRREPTKAEVLQQPPRIFKNREYPTPEPIPGSIPAPMRTLPAGQPQLMLPQGRLPAMSPPKAKQFMAKYGQAPEVKTEIKSGRPVFVGESGQASVSRNKAGSADVSTSLGDTEFSDIGILSKGNLDMVRNFRSFFGARSQEFVDKYIAPFQKAKDVMYRNLEAKANELEKNVVKGLGIERGSKESAAVQEFGEGLRSKESLVKEFGKEKASSIIKADKWFRAQYDRMLAEVNKARSYVYPNQPDKQIQRRGDYYRHFRELQDGFQGLANIFETPAGIDNKLAGISDRTKPQSKWLSLAQKRLGMKTDVDAVGGFIDYIGAAEYAKNVDPAIRRFRQLAAEVADQGNRTGKDYNNFVGYLERIAEHLSGKTNPLDRGVQEFTGRTAFRVVDWLNRRVKANTILGNASSSLAQIFALPAGISSAGEGNFLKGTKRLYQSIGKDDAVMRQSQFLRERYFNALDKFDKGIFNNTKKFAVWMVTALDEMATKAIWNSHYEKALSEGIQNPIKYADEITGNIVGRRGIGETPLLQQSKTFQMAAPFQLEVANAWPLMKELSDAGKGKILKLFLYTYLFNQGVKAIRGSDVAFDPINASIEGYQSASEEDTLGGKMAAFGGRMAGEVLSNVPLGQTMAGLYPEYGANDVMGSGVNLPTREKLFGKGDPTRFGSGLLVAKGLQDPLYKVLMPFGGAQVERTIEGLKAWGNGYKENSSGKVQYPVEQNLRNFIQGGVFGPSSVPEAQSYYKNEQTPLGEVQSEKFKMGGGKQYYDKVMNDRKAEKEKTEKANGLVGVANAGGEGQVRRLSNGKFYIQKLDKEFDTEAKAKRAIALDEWMKSDQETLEYDGKFYTKDDSTDQGYRTQSMEEKKKADTTKDIALSTEKMQRYKAEKDIENWSKEANVLYQKLWKKLQTETDEVERLKIENDMQTLAVQFNKYKGYSGFSKPKKAKKVNIPSMNDADFIVKRMKSRMTSLRSFGRTKTNLASVRRPNIRRPKKIA